MVLVQSAPQSLFSRVHPNPARILGIAGAIALNIALLMALMMPMQTPPAPVIEEVPFRWVLPELKEQPPEKPERVPVTRPQPEPVRPVVEPRITTPTVDPPVITDQGSSVDLPVEPLADPGPISPPISEVGPIAGVRLEYASAPPPSYPRRPLTDRIEGQVLLQVLVDVDGKPLQVSIHRSSGNRELDRAAQQHILRRWTFRPAMKDGRAVQAIGLVPIDFKLQ
ncbi:MULTISPECIES: energy transducer TonB [unclassified Lysobacter]|uniref:energy transducer TonB n=1 Tax=unclassified Lysobacter TaxID=2635362 RepID=UPI001F59EF4A|nr:MULTISPECIES: energy transducer TonB [unclassified Lysobacter]HEX5662724.1 TonB family protein [Xanthomonadaceae bacterium]